MFCTNCGGNLTDGANFCKNCGAAVKLQASPPLNPGYYNGRRIVPSGSREAADSLIYGILGVIFMIAFVGGIFGIMAIVRSAGALRAGYRGPVVGFGLALGILSTAYLAVICFYGFIHSINF